jgi:transposase InsO family protein
VDQQARTRLRWIQLYEETADAGLVCRRCGVSRPTLRKWLSRYKADGLKGLASRSRKPLRSPATKVFAKQEAWILSFRRERKLGARRIQNELLRLHQLSLSLATIHKVLDRHDVGPLRRHRRIRKHHIRYSRPTPGDRVQMDNCKIAPRLYQYTAVDDCTRMRVVGLYPRRTAACSLAFLDKAIEELPFPIQRLQTDRGKEFFAHRFQERLLEYGIKFRPTKPRSPHLNGKVERSQKTDLDEFYSTVDLDDPALTDKLQEWQHHYNWERPHGSLNGRAPIDRFFDLIQQTPLQEEVSKDFDDKKERIQSQDYASEMRFRKLKGSL